MGFISICRKFGKKTWSLEGIDTDKRAVEAATRSGLKVHWAKSKKICPITTLT
jgi:hypothetical protein